jgi:predicted membrane protein
MTPTTPPTPGQNNFGYQSSIGAVVLIAIGLLFFLDNLGIVPSLRPYWPLTLSAVGILMLTRWSSCSFVWALTLILAGVLVTAGNLGYIHANFGNIWPIWLIAAGASMLFKRGGNWIGPFAAPWSGSGPERHFGPGFGPMERLRRKFSGNIQQENAIFAGVNRRIDSQNFEGADLNCTFGELKVDLRGAAISTPNRQATIRVNAAFGAIKLRVPETWRVVVHGDAVFGAYEDKTVPPRPTPGIDPPTVTIIGNSVFGGVEIDN